MVLSGWPPVTEASIGWEPTWLVNLVASFSFMTHYQSIQRGVLDIRDIFYYLSFIFFMLYTNGVILLSRKF
jgi:ABC-2 type transport system permease protein